MASISDAQHAKEVLKLRIGNAAWLRGIGIGGKAGDYCIKVNVDKLTPDVKATVPALVEGVRVVVDAVGEIRALNK